MRWSFSSTGLQFLLDSFYFNNSKIVKHTALCFFRVHRLSCYSHKCPQYNKSSMNNKLQCYAYINCKWGANYVLSPPGLHLSDGYRFTADTLNIWWPLVINLAPYQWPNRVNKISPTVVPNVEVRTPDGWQDDHKSERFVFLHQ